MYKTKKFSYINVYSVTDIMTNNLKIKLTASDATKSQNWRGAMIGARREIIILLSMLTTVLLIGPTNLALMDPEIVLTPAESGECAKKAMLAGVLSHTGMVFPTLPPVHQATSVAMMLTYLELTTRHTDPIFIITSGLVVLAMNVALMSHADTAPTIDNAQLVTELTTKLPSAGVWDTICSTVTSPEFIIASVDVLLIGVVIFFKR